MKGDKMNKVSIYTDGSCSGNPGPGGWAAILLSGEHYRELSGNKKHTTNNEMEMVAVLMGLNALKSPCEVTVYTDSQLVIGWLQEGYKCKASHIVRLRTEIQTVMAGHTVRFVKTDGHSGDPYNDLADALAREALLRLG
jgi:ribonuclease HI